MIYNIAGMRLGYLAAAGLHSGNALASIPGTSFNAFL